MTTILDTDTLFGLMDDHDALHTRAIRIANTFIKQETTIFLLSTTLGEFATLATIKTDFENSKKMTNFILSQPYKMMDMTSSLASIASTIYMKQTSKGNSLFDCYVMAAARDLKVDCIFSFDHAYTQNGFTLAENLLYP